MLIEFSAIEDAFLFVSMDAPLMNQVYLDRETGETYFVSALGDSDELPEDIDDTVRYIAIPHQKDLNLGFSLVEAFVRVYIPEDFANVQNIFRRKGAYRRYKIFLESKQLLDDWYQFEGQHTTRALKAWCLENNIEL